MIEEKVKMAVLNITLNEIMKSI
jgi:hypothetical protein